MRPFTVFFTIVLFFLNINLSLGQNDISYDINTDDFPKVSIDFNLRNPIKKSEKDFLFLEEGKEVDFEIKNKTLKSDSSVNKNILFLVENLNQSKRNKFYKEVLKGTVAKVVKSGDKINIAVFDRVRNSGKKTTFLLLSSYTDNIEEINKAIDKMSPLNDKLSNNKSPDVYHAIYEGLTVLNKEFKENRFLYVLSSAYNNKWSGHNSFIDSKTYAREHNIPIYSIQYFIPGGEAHKLTALVDETYGGEKITKKADIATDALVNFINDSQTNLLGQNYQLSYDSKLDQDGVLYKSTLTTGGKNYNIDITTPSPSATSLIFGKYLFYTLGLLLASLLALGFLVTTINKNKIEREAQIQKINEEQFQKDREIKEAKAKLDQQINETNRLKQNETNKNRREINEKSEQALFIEMKKLGPLPKIELQSDAAQTIFDMKKSKIKLGRDAYNDLVIPDKTVSRKHATIYFSDNQYFIRDDQSKSGVIVNGKKVDQKVKIKHNDVIQLGASRITFIC